MPHGGGQPHDGDTAEHFARRAFYEYHSGFSLKIP
jgi:hypothetical protein